MAQLAVLAQADPTTTCGPAEEASALCEAVFRATDNAVVAQAADVLLVKPARIGLVLLLAFVVTKLLRRAIARAVRGDAANRLLPGTSASRRALQRAETIGALLRSIASFTIWTVAGITVLGELGVNLGPLIAGAGIVGIALGFGAQNLVRDFLSGIFMLVEDQYGVGDVIDAGPATGTVEAVSLRTTRLRDVQGVVWHIPNGGIDRVGNKSQQWSRALLDIAVAYATDIDTACAAIKTIADGMWRDPAWADVILEEPEVWGVEDLGVDGVVIRLVVKTVPLEQWKVARELRARIKQGLDQAGIEIPFPQRMVWTRNDEVPSPN